MTIDRLFYARIIQSPITELSNHPLLMYKNIYFFMISIIFLTPLMINMSANFYWSITTCKRSILFISPLTLIKKTIDHVVDVYNDRHIVDPIKVTPLLNVTCQHTPPCFMTLYGYVLINYFFMRKSSGWHFYRGFGSSEVLLTGDRLMLD